MLCGKLITKEEVSNGGCPEVTLLNKLKGGSEIPATCLPMLPDSRSLFQHNNTFEDAFPAQAHDSYQRVNPKIVRFEDPWFLYFRTLRFNIREQAQ